MRSLKDFSAQDRNHELASLQTDTFDILVIGGGITGAGVARDAVTRGLKVALIEKDDFSQGTSSRSSKLIHGGIRYLENLEFGLVFEALTERRLLLESAPHLVHPLRFVLPVYEDSRVGFFKLGLGMWLYDLLSLFDAPEPHQRWSKSESQDLMPFLRSSGLKGCYSYYDAYMDDDRLVLEVLRSAKKIAPQRFSVCSKVKASKGIELGAEGITRVHVTDTKSNQSFWIKAKQVVASVGPWSDQLGFECIPNWSQILRPTKGVHIVISRDRMDLADALVMAVDHEERIVFAIPRRDCIILGTTDDDFKGSPDTVSVDKHDVDYLLKVTNFHFPGVGLTEKDIISSYAGVRPLVRDESSSQGKTSREHQIYSPAENITLVAGGKYTTYRVMAEQVVDLVTSKGELGQQCWHQTVTDTLPINPMVQPESYTRALGQAQEFAVQFTMKLEDAKELLCRFGGEAWSIASHAQDNGYMTRWQMEAFYAIHCGFCDDLSDFCYRRTPLVLTRGSQAYGVLNEVATVFASELGWDAETLASQMEKASQNFRKETAWQS